MQKKEYYANIIEMNKNNIKSLWKVMNSIIRNSKMNQSFSSTFTVGNKCMDNMNDIVDRFNEYFVNIGSELSKQIGENPHKDQFFK